LGATKQLLLEPKECSCKKGTSRMSVTAGPVFYTWVCFCVVETL